MKHINMSLQSYGGFYIKPIGILNAEVKLGEVKTTVNFVVVNLKRAVPILGHGACVDLKLIKPIDTVNSTGDKSTFVHKNSDVF